MNKAVIPAGVVGKVKRAARAEDLTGMALCLRKRRAKVVCVGGETCREEL